MGIESGRSFLIAVDLNAKAACNSYLLYLESVCKEFFDEDFAALKDDSSYYDVYFMYFCTNLFV